MGKYPVDFSLPELTERVGDSITSEVSLGIRPYDVESLEVSTANGDSSPRRLHILGYCAAGRFDYFPAVNRCETVRPLYSYEDEAGVQKNIEALGSGFSRIMFIDSFLPSGNKFALTTFKNIINVRYEDLHSIDLSDVCASIARRFIPIMRDAYSAGKWQETLQLQLAAQRIAEIKAFCIPKPDSKDLIQITDSHLQEYLTKEEPSGEIGLIGIRALEQGIRSLRDEGRMQAALHGERWLAELKKGVEIIDISPELTPEDIISLCNPLNPDPTAGIPYILRGVAFNGPQHILYFRDGEPTDRCYRTPPIHYLPKRPELVALPEDAKPHHWGKLEAYKDTFERDIACNVVEKLISQGSDKQEAMRDYAAICEEARSVTKKKVTAVIPTIRLLLSRTVALLDERPEQALVLISTSFDSHTNMLLLKAEDRPTSIGTIEGRAKARLASIARGVYAYNVARLKEKHPHNTPLQRHIAVEEERCVGNRHSNMHLIMSAGDNQHGQHDFAESTDYHYVKLKKQIEDLEAFILKPKLRKIRTQAKE